MNSTTLICKKCKAPLEYEDGSSVLTCSCCGYSEKIDESDAVTIERIRAKNERDIELEKKNIENNADVEKKRIVLEEKNLVYKNRMNYVRLIICVIIALIVAGVVYKIAHKDQVKVPLPASAYCQRNYMEAFNLLQDVGFTNVQYAAIDDLTMSERALDGIVSQVSINGDTGFASNVWFPKTSAVRITYHTLDPLKADDIEIPMSSVDCLGKQYHVILDVLENSGFHNIETVPYADLSMDHQNDDGKITAITIDNHSEFYQGDYCSSGSKIIISYHTMDPERVSDVPIPGDSSSFIGRDYMEVCKEFRSAGFSAIYLIPQYNLGIFEGSKNGDTQNVSVNGNSTFVNGAWVPNDSIVSITFRTQRYRITGEKYQSVVELLSSMGFSDISVTPLNDLDVSELKNAETVESVFIAGKDFEKVDELYLPAHVDVNYHSERMATKNQVKMTVSSKEMIGKHYQEVEEALMAMGFSNIEIMPDADLLNNWFGQENTVKSVKIGNTAEFAKGEIFEKNAEIVVSYHVLR